MIDGQEFIESDLAAVKAVPMTAKRKRDLHNEAKGKLKAMLEQNFKVENADVIFKQLEPFGRAHYFECNDSQAALLTKWVEQQTRSQPLSKKQILALKKQIAIVNSKQNDIEARYRNASSLPEIMLACNMMEAPTKHGFVCGDCHYKYSGDDTKDNLNFIKVRENYFNNSIRIPILQVLIKIQEENRQMTEEEVKTLVKGMTLGYQAFSVAVKNMISEAENSVIEKLAEFSVQEDSHGVMGLTKSDYESDFQQRMNQGELNLIYKETQNKLAILGNEIKNLNKKISEAEPDSAELKELNEQLEKKVEKEKKVYEVVKTIKQVNALNENARMAEDHYKGSVKELIGIYNVVKSKPLTEKYYELKERLKDETLGPNERKALKAELKTVHNQLNSSSKLRTLAFSQRTQKTVDDRAQRYNASVINYMQQGAIPSMGTSGGLCYGYSYLFTDAFNDLPPNATLEQTQRAIQGKKQTELEHNNNSLGMSLAAYCLWDSQFDTPPKDCLYVDSSQRKDPELTGVSKVKDKVVRNLEIKKFKRSNFCNQIIHHSKNMPCTFMLSIGSKTSGHAIGFSRNEHGIWLHDSNFGLVFFDSRDPDYEKNFKRFFSKHIESTYPKLQHRFEISNTKIRHDLEKGLELTLAVIGGLEKLNAELCPDAMTKVEELCGEIHEELKALLPEAYGSFLANNINFDLSTSENLLVNLEAIKKLVDVEIGNIEKVKRGITSGEPITAHDQENLMQLDLRLAKLRDIQQKCSTHSVSSQLKEKQKQLSGLSSEFKKIKDSLGKDEPEPTRLAEIRDAFSSLKNEIKQLKHERALVINPDAVHAANIKKSKVELQRIYNPSRKKPLDQKEKVRVAELLGHLNQAQGHLVSLVLEKPSLMSQGNVGSTIKETHSHLNNLGKHVISSCNQPKLENPSAASSVQKSLISFMGKLGESMSGFVKSLKKILSPKKVSAIEHKQKHAREQVVDKSTSIDPKSSKPNTPDDRNPNVAEQPKQGKAHKPT